MKCKDVDLTEKCKSCIVGSKEANCPTVGNSSNTIIYYVPPYTIFNLNPTHNNIGVQVICVEDNINCKDIKQGEILTIIDQVNEQFGYIRFDKFKDYPNKWFGPDRFKKLKATYEGKEYSLNIRSA